MTAKVTAKELVEALQLTGSIAGNTLLGLPQQKIDILMGHFDPQKDYLIDINEHHFSINYGKVGNFGIQYSF